MPMHNVQILMVRSDANVSQVMRAQDFCVLVSLYLVPVLLHSKWIVGFR